MKPILYGSLNCPIDSSESNPSISFGGSSAYNSGTGIFADGDGVINFSILGSQMLQLTEDGLLGPGSVYAGSSSFQPIAIDLELDAGAGKNIASGTAFLSPMMGNLLGASLTKTGNYLAGAIGAYSITGALATHLQAGGLMGIIMDGVTQATGAVVAVIDGDSGITRATAAFAARMNNSTPGSGIDYGLDLYGAAHDGFSALPIANADIRMSGQTCILQGAGVPSDGTTGDNFAGKGSLYIDTTNGKLYINTGAITNPTWVVVGSQS